MELWWIGLWTGLAAAQTQATLLEGDSLLEPCLEDAACAPALLGLVSENVAEYGFVAQADPIAISALGGKGMGLVAEVRIDTATLGPKNALEQRVFLPPALPRIAVGYQYGSYTYDNPYPQLAVGLTALPPIHVLGGTVFSVQADASGAVPLGTEVLWLGAEIGYGFSELVAPVVGTPAELADIPEIGPWLPERAPSACDGIGRDCVDRFAQHAVSARGGISVEPLPAVFCYARAAAVAVVQRIAVAYDRTTWGMGGVQIQAQGGVGVRAGDKHQLAMGVVSAPRPPEQTTTGARTLTKVTASTSFRFGRPRYWERDLPPEERQE